MGGHLGGEGASGKYQVCGTRTATLWPRLVSDVETVGSAERAAGIELTAVGGYETANGGCPPPVGRLLSRAVS